MLFFKFNQIVFLGVKTIKMSLFLPFKNKFDAIYRASIRQI